MTSRAYQIGLYSNPILSPGWKLDLRWLMIAITFSGLISRYSLADELFFGVTDEISDITAVSGSKREEDLFSSPLSISVISAEQIKKAGVISIPEALRLIPGVIVREQTNGQFSVHIRGFDNVPAGTSLTGLSNRFSLIMVDNRKVYDYFNGGLFWETLPFTIDDIERIEVIRGAASALYGSNAMTGVIHFITKRAEGDTTLEANLMAANPSSTSGHFATEHSFGMTNFRLSGFTDQRDRYQTTYYSFAEDQYLPVDQINFTSGIGHYPDPEKARDAHALMLSLNNDPTERFAYDLSFSHQDSRVQKVHISSSDTPLTINDSNTSAVNINLNYDAFFVRASHLWGKQATLDIPDFNYDKANSQISMEYQFRKPQWIIRPGISYKSIVYDGPFIGGERRLREAGYLLRTEYFPTPQYRLVAALRYDDYNLPSDNYFSYQILGTYRLHHDTLLRAAIETANRSSFMINHYLDLMFTFPNNPSRRVDISGDPEAELVSITTVEIGLRHQLNFNNWFEIELFRSDIEDFTSFIVQGTGLDGSQLVTTRQLEWLPTEATQLGVTVDWHYEAVNWDLNIFLTAQDTHVDEQAVSISKPLTFINTDNKGTPDYYGGVVHNWQPLDRWNINTHVYYLSSHTFALEQTQGNAHNASAMYANLTISHRFNNWLNGFVSARNLSNQSESQHFFTDHIDPLYVVGINLKWAP